MNKIFTFYDINEQFKLVKFLPLNKDIQNIVKRYIQSSVPDYYNILLNVYYDIRSKYSIIGWIEQDHEKIIWGTVEIFVNVYGDNIGQVLEQLRNGTIRSLDTFHDCVVEAIGELLVDVLNKRYDAFTIRTYYSEIKKVIKEYLKNIWNYAV